MTIDLIVMAWRWLFGERYYVLEYCDADVVRFAPGCLGSAVHVSDEAELFGSTPNGVFRTRRDAVSYRDYINHRYSPKWPLVPSEVVRITKEEAAEIEGEQTWD